jgi:sortase A
MRRHGRRLGYVLAGAGVTLGVWIAVTLWRGDPVTGAYASYRQHVLAAKLDAAARRSAVSTRDVVPTTYRVPEGGAWGRIVIPRTGTSAVVVEGTRRRDLDSGPGHYRITSFPGRGRTVAIAGHRTTFGAWFRHIDSLRRGDAITLAMPYGTFRYRVTGHRVVTPDDWSIVANLGYDRLVLSACHPLYSASHRWIVFAKLVRRG